MAQAISASTKRLSINSSVLTKWARRTVFYILLLAFWQVLASLAIWPDYLFPGPLAVFNSLVNGFQNGLYLQSTFASLQRLAVGYIIALVVGMVLGLLIGSYPIFEDAVGAVVLLLQPLPSVCWPRLAFLCSGLDAHATLFV